MRDMKDIGGTGAEGALPRRDALKFLGALGLALPFGGLLASCGGENGENGENSGGGPNGSSRLEELRSAGELRIAVVDNPPYCWTESGSGELTGAIPAIVRAVMESLGVPKIVGITTSYDSFIPGLMAGRWDTFGSTLQVSAAGCEQIQWSHPVTFDGQSILLRENDPFQPSTIAELVESDRMVAVASESGQPALILREAGIKDENVLVLGGYNTSLMDAVRSKRADAAVAGYGTTQWLLRSDDGGLKINYPVSDAPSSTGATGFRPDDTDFSTAFNDELLKFKQSSQYMEILSEYGLTEPDPEQRSMTAEEACEAKSIEG